MNWESCYLVVVSRTPSERLLNFSHQRRDTFQAYSTCLVTALLQHLQCPWGGSSSGHHGTLKPGQQKGWGSGFCRAQRHKEPKALLQAFVLIINSSLPCHLPFSCLINPFSPPQATFFCDITLGFAPYHLSWIAVSGSLVKGREIKRSKAQREATQTSSKTKKIFCPLIYL